MVTAVRSKAYVPELIEKQHRDIIKAATELFGRRGYHVTTTREIAIRAKVSIGLVSQYVDSKEELLFLALLQVFDSYERDIPAALAGLKEPLERLRAAVLAYCRAVDQRLDAVVLAYRETKSLRKERRELIKRKETETNALIAACVEECIAAGSIDRLDVDLFTYQIVMFCHGWALKAWHFKTRMSVDTYVERGLQLMLNPVLSTRHLASTLAASS